MTVNAGVASRLNSTAYTAADERHLDSVLWTPGAAAAPFSARGGRRVNGKGLAVSIGGSPESWTVTPGAALIYDPTYASLGPWRIALDASISEAMPARPGTGQSRIDLIVAYIEDTDSSVGTTRDVYFARVPGTPGTSPTAPSAPALSIVLATLNVPASGTVTVTPSAARTVAAGGILPVATSAERDVLPDPWDGLTVKNAQTGLLEVYSAAAAAFQPISLGDTGWTNLTLSSGYAMSGTATPQQRLKGGQVRLRGAIVKSSGSFTSGTQVATVTNPPSVSMQFATAASPTNAGFRVSISSAGAVSVAITSGATVPTTVYLDGITYDVD